MKEYTDLKDVNNKRLYIGCEVKVPSLDTILGKEEKYDIFVLKRDKNTSDLFFEDCSGQKYDTNFIGISNIILNI